MAPRRKKIPESVEISVLVKSRRRCCLCFFLERQHGEVEGQIAHLDHNRDNHAEDNLVFLCFNHHNRYDSKMSTSHGLKEGEVRVWRNKLYMAMMLFDRDDYKEVEEDLSEPKPRT
jgi:hypothetical protein